MAQVFVTTEGASNANSYVTVAEADQYIENRYGTTSTWTTYSALSTARKQEILILATDYIEQRYGGRWNTGAIQTSTQRLSWPRNEAYKHQANNIYLVSSIPIEIKDATCEAATLLISAETDLYPTYDRLTKSERVGNLEVVYMDSAGALKTFPKVQGRLRDFLFAGARIQRG